MRTEDSVVASPFVSVAGLGGSLWAPDWSATSSDHLAAFGPVAAAAWRDAALALPRSVPVLWQSVDRAQATMPRGRRTANLHTPDRQPAVERVLEGRSFGLSFLLVMAASVLDTPLPVRFVASAEIDPNGGVQGVEDIRTKVEIVASRFPGGTLLVAPESEKDAIAQAAGRIDVVSVRTGGAALTVVFGDDLADLIVRCAPSRRGMLVDSFWRLAMGGRSGAVDWAPVARAVERALEWKGLDQDARHRLDMVHNIALRHEYNEGRQLLPPEAWIRSLPAPLMVDVIANLVQHAADTARPAPVEVEALAHTVLVPVREAYVPQLRLWGALARLLAVTGRVAEAMRMQEDVATAFADALGDDGASFPLTEWFRLSGVQGDSLAYERAEQFRVRLVARGGLGFGSHAYVDLARAKAQVMLGVADGETQSVLADMSGNARIPSHVRWSAARWYARVLDEAGRRDETDAALAALQVAGTSETSTPRERHEGKMARVFSALIQLDRALRDDDQERVAATSALLTGEEPGVAANLSTGVQSPRNWGRFYPY